MHPFQLFLFFQYSNLYNCTQVWPTCEGGPRKKNQYSQGQYPPNFTDVMYTRCHILDWLRLNNYVPLALGMRGTSKFTVVFSHRNVSWHPSVCVRVCARLHLRTISYSFSLLAFKFSDMVTMDKTLNWLTFCDLDSIFKVTGGDYVSKLTLLMQ